MARIEPRFELWRLAPGVNQDVLHSSASQGDTTVVISDAIAQALVPGERFVIGMGPPVTGPSLFDDPNFTRIVSSTGGYSTIALDSPLSRGYTSGTPCYQQLQTLFPATGLERSRPWQWNADTREWGQSGQKGVVNPYDNDITFAVNTDAQIVGDSTQDVTRQLTITLNPAVPLGATRPWHFHPYNAVIKVFVDYFDADGNVLMDIPFGVFIVANAEKDVQMIGTSWKCTMSSWEALLRRVTPNNPFCLQGNTTAYTALAQVLATMDPFPVSLGGTGTTPQGFNFQGPGLWNGQVHIEGSDQVIPIPVTIDVGTDLLTFANALFDAICWRRFYALSDAGIHSTPKPYWTNAPLVSEYDFWVAPDGMPLPDAIAAGHNATIPDPLTVTIPANDQLWNGIRAGGAPSTGSGGIWALAYNVSPKSPISLVSLGQPATTTIQDDMIPDQKTAQLRADLELQNAAQLAETISFQCAPLPMLELYSGFTLNVVNQDGQWVVESNASNPFVCTGFTAPLFGGTWTITAQIAVNLGATAGG